MKITKRQLRRIIKEEIRMMSPNRDEDQEYDRGYDDAYQGYPNDADRSTYPQAYDAGYEQGTIEAEA